ncbi:MAG: hypothetical protein ACOC5T_04430 [Elusimicrobiota bacterium]
MILQYKRLSLTAARVSEITAVSNLVADYIRNDGYLRDEIGKGTVSSYLSNGEKSLKGKLEMKIENSGYEDIVINIIEEIDNGVDNLTKIHVLLRDNKLGKEEDVYVVIFTK